MGDMKNYSLREAKEKTGLSARKVAFLIRKGLIEPIIEEGKVLVSENELQRYLSLPKSEKKKHHVSFLKSLGPGLITGAADDDQSGVVTYSQVGARFGLSLSWMAIYLLPMMTAVQETCARIGLVTGHGLAKTLSKYYKKPIVFFLVFLLIITNTINIGADLGAMSAVLGLLLPINYYLGLLIVTGIMIFLVIKFKYHQYARILKWLTVVLFSYIFAGILSSPDWPAVLRNIVVPKISLSTDYLMAIVAVMGTTISPYLFFWQTSEEVEEEHDKKVLEHQRVALKTEIKEMRKDTYTGMSMANLVFLFIVITTATVLFNNGVHNIETARDAALALKPFAGDLSYLLFAIGMIGIGFLAIPVLAGSSAYAIAEIFKWREGLYRKYSSAKGFYGVIIYSMLIGALINVLGINPMKALYYSAVINGITAPILLYFIFKIGNDKKIMGDFSSPGWIKVVGFSTTVLMSVAAILLIILSAIGG